MTRLERAPQRCALQTAEPQTRPVALVELITTVLLALSTFVAATAVSIGIARADVAGIRADGELVPDSEVRIILAARSFYELRNQRALASY